MGHCLNRSMDALTNNYYSVARWHDRKHGEVCFHLSQALSCHGCFAKYLHRFGKLESPECWFCGHTEDDVHHTIFSCDAWYARRRKLEIDINSEINPNNLINIIGIAGKMGFNPTIHQGCNVKGGRGD